MTAYSYDPKTGEYLCEDECQPDPLDGGWLLAAHATFDPPPKAAEGQVALWRGGGWEIVADARATAWWHKVTGERYVPELPEEKVNADFYVEKPPTGQPFEYWDDAAGAWLVDKAQKDAEVAARVDSQLREEIMTALAATPEWQARRTQLETAAREVRDA